ncbi:MAG: RNA polymerase sigma factor [Solirubrobacteraceae bacterium]
MRRSFLAGGLPDEALVAAMADGDVEAVAAFIRRYQSRVYGLCLRIVGDPDLAEDLAQETLVRVWLHAAIYDLRRGQVSSWVLTIARNLAVDARRLKRSVPLAPELLESLLTASTDLAPEECALRADALSSVRTALARLPEEQRRAVVLTTFYGWSAAEIAVADSVPVPTAKTRIRTGLKKVRAALATAEV